MNTQHRIFRIERYLETVAGRYDAEHDIIPDAPVVTWADRQLLEMIEDLLKVIKDLQATVDGIYEREGRHL